MNPQGSLTK